MTKNEIELRDRVLKKMDDLRNKLVTNEPTPENGGLNLESLYEIEERIDEALSAWYY